MSLKIISGALRSPLTHKVPPGGLQRPTNTQLFILGFLPNSQSHP